MYVTTCLFVCVNIIQELHSNSLSLPKVFTSKMEIKMFNVWVQMPCSERVMVNSQIWVKYLVKVLLKLNT